MSTRKRRPNTPHVFHNRVAAIAFHIDWYSGQCPSRLAADSGVHPKTVSRVLVGRHRTSFLVALKVFNAIVRRLEKPVPMSEVFSEDGTYPTTYVCELVGCGGCWPKVARTEAGDLRKAYRHLAKGQWTGDTAEFSKGGR